MKQGLGRGLDSLIGNLNKSEVAQANKSSIEQIYIGDIEPDSEQPREYFDSQALESLKQSIKEHGVLQPIIVRPFENRYIIVAGERRYRCCKELNIKYIPALKKDIGEAKALEIAVIENLQREDLNVLEKAQACERLINLYGYTHEDIAEKLSMNRSTVTNLMRLLNLPVEVQEYLISGDLSMGIAKVILSIPSIDEQIKATELYLAKRMTVKDFERVIKSREEKKEQEKSREKEVKKIEPDILEMEDKLKMKWGTKVNIKYDQKTGRGKVIIHCNNLEDFDRILEESKG